MKNNKTIKAFTCLAAIAIFSTSINVPISYANENESNANLESVSAPYGNTSWEPPSINEFPEFWSPTNEISGKTETVYKYIGPKEGNDTSDYYFTPFPSTTSNSRIITPTKDPITPSTEVKYRYKNVGVVGQWTDYDHPVRKSIYPGPGGGKMIISTKISSTVNATISMGLIDGLDAALGYSYSKEFTYTDEFNATPTAKEDWLVTAAVIHDKIKLEVYRDPMLTSYLGYNIVYKPLGIRFKVDKMAKQ